MDAVTHLVRPSGNLLQGLARIAQICRAVHQQTVAGGAAQRIDHDQLAVGKLLAKLFGGCLSALHRLCHAGAKGDMQHVALLEQLGEELHILVLVELRGGGDLLLEQLIKPLLRVRVALHIIGVFLAAGSVGIK